MSKPRPVLLIPSETQLREFDPKLLLACFAAERGFRSIIGSRMAMHARIASLPVGLYLAKDVYRASTKMFSILKGLGHRIVAWDEEGLLVGSQDLYLRMRIAPKSLAQVECFMAWGPADRDFLATAPVFANTPVVATGNPRMDLMRPELRTFFAPEVAALRARHGRFVLINTNFGRLNSFLPSRNLTPSAPGELALRNLRPTDLPLATWIFRERLFNHFKKMVPALAAALPELRIVVRPHPSERVKTWRELAAGHANVEVVREGHIAPWLLAAEALVQNGCTTGFEAFLLDVPSIAYEPERAQDWLWRLPNDLSFSVPDMNGLVEAVRKFSGGNATMARARAQRDLAARYLTGIDGKLACERILDQIEALLADAPAMPSPPLLTKLSARRRAAVRAIGKTLQSLRRGHKNSARITRQRFPGVSLKDVEADMARLGAILGRFDGVRAKKLAPNLFAIEPAST